MESYQTNKHDPTLYGLFGLKFAGPPKLSREVFGRLLHKLCFQIIIIITYPSHENVKIRKWEEKNRTYDIADDKNPRINGTSANLGQLQPKRTPKKELEGSVGWNLTYVTYYSVSKRVLDFRSAWDRTGLPDDHTFNMPK